MKEEKPSYSLVRPQGSASGLTGLMAGVLVVVVLYFARAFFIPIALSLLLTFVLAPVVLRLRKIGLGRVSSVLLAVTLSFALMTAMGLFVSLQFLELVKKLPDYRQNIQTKLESFRVSKEGPVGRVTAMFRDLSNNNPAVSNRIEEIEKVVEREPVLVKVKPAESTPVAVVSHYLRPMLGPLATAGSVVVFVIFMLLQREDLRDRILGLIGEGRLSVTTQALDDAAGRVSRYLLMQLMVNGLFAIPFGIGLYFIGVPNAALWALLAALLRFIPYVGPVIGAIMPIGLAFAVHPGWAAVVETAALFMVLELTVSNVVEPWLYGSSTGVSAIAILVAAVFWTWLWGPIGLLLSTPLTVCLVVMGRYIPHLNFLSVLLSDEQVLTVEARFYQRMVAMDEDEMTDLVEKELKTKSVEEVYDQVIIPALLRTEKDRHVGAVSDVLVDSIVENARDLIEDIHRDGLTVVDKKAATVEKKIPTELRPTLAATVLCIPARSGLDELTCVMLKQLLEKRGIGAEVFPADKLVGECIEEIRKKGFQCVCICAIPPAAVAPARSWCRRLSTQFPNLPAVVAIWSAEANLEGITRRLAAAPPEAVVGTLADACARIISLSTLAITDPLVPAPTPDDEAERMSEVQRLGLVDGKTHELFDQTTRELARVFDAPMALLSLVEADRETWKAQTGLPSEFAAQGETPRATSLAGHVVAHNDVLVVEDILKDPRFANNPVWKEQGIRFYAAAPLRSRNGHPVGALGILDKTPRMLSPRDKMLLQSTADRLMADTERRMAREQPAPVPS